MKVPIPLAKIFSAQLGITAAATGTEKKHGSGTTTLIL